MKRILSVVVVAVLAVGSVHAQPFPDVPEGHWAAEAVERLARTGILVGYPDGQFRGNEAFTRYHAALVIDRLYLAIADSVPAREAVFWGELVALREAVDELAGENVQLREAVAANREALELLWDELAEVRERLDLPPPAPLPPALLPGPPGERGPAGPPGEDAGVGELGFAGEADAADAPEDVIGDAPVDAPGAGDAPAGEPGLGDGVPGDDEADVGLFAAPGAARGYIGLGVGAELPSGVLLRAIGGIDDYPAPRFGVRLMLDVEPRGAAAPTAASLAGHLTYGTEIGTAVGGTLDGYVGVGAGVDFAGDGAYGSLLLGTVWTVGGPVQLFAETTFDVFLQPGLPSSGSRVSPAFVAGARWAF